MTLGECGPPQRPLWFPWQQHSLLRRSCHPDSAPLLKGSAEIRLPLPFATSASVHSFLIVLPFSLPPSLAGAKMCLLSSYQQPGPLRVVMKWERLRPPCPGTRPPYPLPIPVPTAGQQPGSFQLPRTERISEALGGVCTHAFVQEKSRPCVCRRGSQQGGWLGIPTRIKSRVPLTCKGPMSWMQMAVKLSVFCFRKGRVASSEILACGYHRSLEVVRDKPWGRSHSLSFFSLVVADLFLLISKESRYLQAC